MTAHHTPRRAQPPAGSGTSASRWFAAVAVLVLLTEQTALGFTLIAPALMGFATEFQTTQVIWVITIFVLIGSITTPLIGKLGDRYGKKKVLVYATLVTIVGSVICALAPSFGVLLFGRALMGVSTAFLPVTFALIRDVFPESYRNMSLAIATNGVGVITIVGPFLAGYLIDNHGQESVFWFVGGISVIGALGTIALVPESPVRNKARIDVVGAVGLAAGLLLIMYGTSQLQTWQFSDIRTFLTIGGGLAVLVAWWFWEDRANEPFIDTKLLASRPIATVIFAYALGGAGITIMASYLPTMLQTPRALGGDYGFGLSATGVARYLVAAGVLTVVSGLIVGALAKRYGFRVFLIAGPVIIAVGAVGLGFLTTESWMPMAFYGLVGLGAVVYAAGPGLLMVLSPPSSRGVTAGMMGAVSGAAGSMMAQLSGLVLSKNIGQTVDGYAVPTGTGFSYVFLIAAAVSIAGVVVAVMIPRREKPVVDAADDEALVVVE
jgi:MFS family permease